MKPLCQGTHPTILAPFPLDAAIALRPVMATATASRAIWADWRRPASDRALRASSGAPPGPDWGQARQSRRQSAWRTAGLRGEHLRSELGKPRSWRALAREQRRARRRAERTVSVSTGLVTTRSGPGVPRLQPGRARGRP